LSSGNFKPVNLCPLDDEILSSWIIRNSIANGSDPSSWAGAIWPNWRAWTRDLDRSIPTPKMQVLSKASGVSMQSLKDMTLEPTVERVLNCKHLNYKKAWPWVVPTGGRNKAKVNGLHYCPLCLSNKPSYFRKSWRLSWVIACPIHQSLLLNKCPCCNQSISPHLVSYLKTDVTRCVSCEFDLTLSTTSCVDPDAFWLQGLLTQSLRRTKDFKFPLNINEVAELFDVVRYLMAFFQHSLKDKKPFRLLHQKLKIDNLNTYYKPLAGVRIEARVYLERHFLMIATARLLKLNLSEISKLFAEVNITRQMFMIGKTSSKVIHQIKSVLPDNSNVGYVSPSFSKSAIKARSKIEVDALMAEILPYLRNDD